PQTLGRRRHARRMDDAERRAKHRPDHLPAGRAGADSRTGAPSMGATKAVTDDTFVSEVLQSDTPVLVDFWAEWCGPCLRVAPVLEEIANELGDKVKVVKLDIDANPNTARDYQVLSVPTLTVFKGGQPVQSVAGARPKGDLVKLIEAALRRV